MNLKKIKVGEWYETNVGTGPCVRVGGTFPPSVQINVLRPLPRGIVNVRPRDVLDVATPLHEFVEGRNTKDRCGVCGERQAGGNHA